MTTASITTTAQIAVDGATVHLTKIDGKLVVSIDDPGCELSEVQLTDHTSGRSLAKVADPAAETLALEIIAPMLEALREAGPEGAKALRRATAEGYLEARDALYGAVNATGRSSYWSTITSVSNRTAAPGRTASSARHWAPFLALVYRDLIGSHGFTAEHYADLTHGWRTVFGPVHADDELPAR